jgi:hypothetical protein
MYQVRGWTSDENTITASIPKEMVKNCLVICASYLNIDLRPPQEVPSVFVGLLARKWRIWQASWEA